MPVASNKLHTLVLTSINWKNNVRDSNNSSAMIKNTCDTCETAFPAAQSIVTTTILHQDLTHLLLDTTAKSSTKRYSITKNLPHHTGYPLKEAKSIKPMQKNQNERKSRSGRARILLTRARRGTRRVWKGGRASLRIIISIGSDFCVNIQPSEKNVRVKMSMPFVSKINAFAFDLPISEPCRFWPSGLEAKLRLHNLLLLLNFLFTARSNLIFYDLGLFWRVGLRKIFILLSHKPSRIHQDLNLLLTYLRLKRFGNRRIPRPGYLPTLTEPKHQCYTSTDHSTTTNYHYNQSLPFTKLNTAVGI